jgi:class 3 adenylate cyclase
VALNRYFDCAMLPVNRHCGEVMQIIGDGILAIFNESVEGGPGAACRQTFEAAKEGIDAPACRNQLRPDGTPHLTAGHWRHT